MKVICLIENSPGHPGCLYEHGLSVYMETARHRILADTGASARILENAALLGVNLSAVDTVFLSHGHYDHAGGVPAFAKRNPRAAIYMQRSAAIPCFALEESGEKYIGIDRSILDLPQLHLLEGSAEIDGELSVLADFPGRRFWSRSNLSLKRRIGAELVQDSFDHEQALVVRQAAWYLLFSGCAHNGILNILDRFREKYGRDPDAVISGFHFMKSEPYTPEETAVIEATAKELSRMRTVFYTGHCTSLPGYDLMKPVMGEQLQALSSGAVLMRGS